MPILYKEEEVLCQLRDGFICDKCGKRYSNEDIIENQELFYWEHIGGYGSLWGDGNTVVVTLCQKCATEIFKNIIKEQKNEL